MPKLIQRLPPNQITYTLLNLETLHPLHPKTENMIEPVAPNPTNHGLRPDGLQGIAWLLVADFAVSDQSVGLKPPSPNLKPLLCSV